MTFSWNVRKVFQEVDPHTQNESWRREWGTFREVEKVITLGNLAYTSGQLVQQALVSMDNLSEVVMDYWQALEYIVLQQGGTCAGISGISHLYSNSSVFTERDIKNLYIEA